MNLEPEVADNLLRCQHNPVPHAPPPLPPPLPAAQLLSLCGAQKGSCLCPAVYTLTATNGSLSFPAGQGRTRLYVGGKPLIVTGDLMIGLPVPEEELSEFLPEQRASLKEYARLVAELKKVSWHFRQVRGYSLLLSVAESQPTQVLLCQ